MSNQDHLLDFEYDESTLSEDHLLGHSDSEVEPMEKDDNIVFVEKEPEDLGSLLACREKDLFSQEEDLSNSQLLAVANAPT